MKATFSIAILLISLTAVMWAQESVTLTLEKAVDLALQKNTQIIQAQNAVSGKQSAVTAAYGSLLPTLGASGSYFSKHEWTPFSGGGQQYIPGFGVVPVPSSGGHSTSESYTAGLGSSMVLDSLGCTLPVADVNNGNLESTYKKLGSMLDKVTEQLKVAETVKAVDAAEVARRVLSTHFMRDLTGNLKAFAAQRFRCSKCNSKFRRVPLKGACTRCGGKLSLTVYKGGVEKYLIVAQDLVDRYNLEIGRAHV
jgi:hypothetical protein